MTDLSVRFSTPISAPRPRGSSHLTAFSPKLERAVRAFDHHGLWQWVRLETDPQITSFCEHPVRLGKDDDARLIDFCVQRGDSEELLVLDRDRVVGQIPASLDGIALRLLPAAKLAAAGIWITNWLRMLPVITATRGLVPKNPLRASRLLSPEGLDGFHPSALLGRHVDRRGGQRCVPQVLLRNLNGHAAGDRMAGV